MFERGAYRYIKSTNIVILLKHYSSGISSEVILREKCFANCLFYSLFKWYRSGNCVRKTATSLENRIELIVLMYIYENTECYSEHLLKIGNYLHVIYLQFVCLFIIKYVNLSILNEMHSILYIYTISWESYSMDMKKRNGNKIHLNKCFGFSSIQKNIY